MGLLVALMAPSVFADEFALNRDDLFTVEVRASFEPQLNDDVFLEPSGVLRGVVWLRAARGESPTIPAVGAQVFLMDGERVVDRAIIEKDGRFALKAGKPGVYQLASEFTPLMKLGEAAGLKTNPIREVRFQKPDDAPKDPAKNPLDPPNPLIDPKNPPKAADPKNVPNPIDPKNPGAVLPEMPDALDPVDEDETPIGTPPNGNASVFLDNDGAFRFLGEKHIVHHASNDEVFLDKTGSFRGVVTYLDDKVIRRPLIKANVYLVQKGEVMGRAVTAKNGSFVLGPVDPGSYTIVAEYGYHTLDSMKTNGTEKAGDSLLGVKYAGRNNIAPPGPVVAWDRERAGLPWQDGAGQLALQRIAVRANDKAVKLGPVTERTRAGAPAIVQVKFQQNGAALPVLHLSPSPWTSTAPTELAATPAAAGGAAAAGGGGGGAAGAAAGGFLPPPFVPGGGNPNFASPE